MTASTQAISASTTAGRVGEHPEHVAGPQERESGAVVVGQLVRANLGEHRFGVLAAAEPRQCMCANEVGFEAGSGEHRGLGQSVGERQIGQPDGAVGRPDQKLGVGWHVGVEAQRGAAHHDPRVVAVIGRREFGSDPAAQPPQPGGCGAFPAHLTVERM
jgi:hypothetical protein